MPLEPIFLRIDEAAQAIGLSRRAVYTLIAANELPSVRIRHALRVPVAELRAWAALQVTTQHAARATDHAARVQKVQTLRAIRRG